MLETPKGAEIEYDLFNRMVKYTKGTDVYTYTYNGDGQRMSKTVNGVTTYFAWDGMDMILERVDYFNNTGYYYGPDGVEFQQYSDGMHLAAAYVKNALGDVVGTYDVMSGVTLYREYCYDAYGNAVEEYDNTNAIPPSENPFRYRGEYYDAETGLYYLRNRYYDPKAGRFITEDPVLDGTNWYTYCYGNPVTFRDPLGLGGEFITMAYRGEESFAGNLELRYFSEKIGATVQYNADSQTASVTFPNGNSAAFTVGVDGTYINEKGLMIVDGNNYKKKLGISQVSYHNVKNKMVYLVRFGENDLRVVYNKKEIGRTYATGTIRNTRASDVDDFDREFYAERKIDASVDLAISDSLAQVSYTLAGAYNLVSLLVNNRGLGDVRSADTKLRFNDRSDLYYYVTIFLAANGDDITYVGSTIG